MHHGILKIAVYIGLLNISSFSAHAGMTPEEVREYERHKIQALQGNQLSEYELGNCYISGKGVPRDEEKGMVHVKSAANKGVAQAQLLLGCTLYALGPNQDYKMSFHWISKAANQGNAVAQSMLAHLYRFGFGTEANQSLANEWELKAAENGEVESAYNLGMAYLFGRGMNTNKGKSALWFKRAADQGHVQAQFELAKLYANGDGVPKDEIEAYAYYNLANGIPNARLAISQLESAMSSDARLVAQQRTKELKKLIEQRVENFDELRQAVEKEKQRKGA